MKRDAADQFGKIYDQVLIWYVTRYCNFSCPQCAGSAITINNKDAPEKINIRALNKFLKKSNKTIKFSFTGGEPLLVENIVDAFQAITERHYLAFISNLVHPRVKEIAKKIDPQRVNFITASAHIRELEKRNLMETFISHCLLLKEKGFTLFLSEVAYPFIINNVEKYKNYFSSKGLALEFMAFRGTWKKKRYPDAYTEEELNIFNLKNEIHTRPDIFNQKNKVCNAGYNIAVIDNNGDVKPCFALHHMMGNIYKKIKFNKSLIKCPMDFCGCPFPAFEQYIFKKAIDESKSPQFPGPHTATHNRLYSLYLNGKNKLKRKISSLKNNKKRN